MKSNSGSRRSNLETFGWFAVATAGGFLCVVLPNLILDRGTVDYPFVRDAIENMSFPHVALALLLFGFFLGWNHPRYWWLLGAATMSAFPIVAIIEMLRNPFSHNLWPIEFVYYAIDSIPAQLGALAGHVLSGKLQKTHPV